MTRGRPGALPERGRHAAPGRARPGDGARPGLPRRHYVMGGILTDLDGRTTVARPVRRRRVRLHRPARREPARLQLAAGVLRVRPPRRARRARRAAARAAPPPPSPDEEPPRRPPSPATRDALWRLAGLERDAAGLRELRERPPPPGAAVAASALHREESRGAHARARLPPTRPGPRPPPQRRPRPASTECERWT